MKLTILIGDHHLFFESAFGAQRFTTLTQDAMSLGVPFVFHNNKDQTVILGSDALKAAIFLIEEEA